MTETSEIIQTEAPPELIPEKKKRPNNNPNGPPKKSIDRELLIKLAKVGMSQSQIAQVLGVSTDLLQINGWNEVIEEHRGELHTKLQSKLVELALEKDNIAAVIFLAKNMLGMSDRQTMPGSKENPLQVNHTFTAEKDIRKLLYPDTEIPTIDAEVIPQRALPRRTGTSRQSGREDQECAHTEDNQE